MPLTEEQLDICKSIIDFLDWTDNQESKAGIENTLHRFINFPGGQMLFMVSKYMSDEEEQVLKQLPFKERKRKTDWYYRNQWKPLKKALTEIGSRLDASETSPVVFFNLDTNQIAHLPKLPYAQEFVFCDIGKIDFSPSVSLDFTDRKQPSEITLSDVGIDLSEIRTKKDGLLIDSPINENGSQFIYQIEVLIYNVFENGKIGKYDNPEIYFCAWPDYEYPLSYFINHFQLKNTSAKDIYYHPKIEEDEHWYFDKYQKVYEIMHIFRIGEADQLTCLKKMDLKEIARGWQHEKLAKKSIKNLNQLETIKLPS